MSRPIVLKPACIKTLSAVEALPNSSNQHEFNGVTQLREIFGDLKVVMPATFSIRGKTISEIVNVTWYDARANNPARTEYRLYFQTNQIMEQADAGDNILIGYENDTLHIMLIPKTSVNFRPAPSAWEPV